MLFVFLVDTGVMYTFDVELAMESVQILMSAVSSVAGIPEEKQVLLISGGETLDPMDRVCNYNSAGTDTSPIYLFSKSTIESSIPPSPSLNLGSEASLKEQAGESLHLPPTYETLMTRAQLASEFDRLAAEISESCESLVSEQRFQQHGWNAVVSNLDNISREFQVRASTVQQIYTEFLEMRAEHMGLLNSFDQVMPVLGKVPVFPILLTQQQSLVARARQNTVSLLEWINAQDNKNSLQDMAKQCMDAVKQFDENSLQEITTEINQVQESLNNSSMKEIKGLDERLSSLQQLMQMVQTLRQSQTDMAQGFLHNKARAQLLGDPSVLPDLCASHQKQLMVLLKNHSQLKDIRRRCAKAKDELSANLHTRLRWIMYVEKKICDCDSTLILYHENIRRLKRRLDIIEQVNEAPKMYVLAVTEVVRRRTFSGQFLKWASKVYESSAETQTEEMLRREEFTLQFGRHFLQSLFTGLDDQVPEFWDKPPKIFDGQLPLITEHDLRELLVLVPELADHIQPVPVSVSMKDESKDVNLPLGDKNLEIQEKLPCFQMTSSIDKASAMSMDASAQGQWMEESAGEDLRREDCSSTAEGHESGGELALEMSVTTQVTEEKGEPTVATQKTNGNSDTGSERSSGLEDNDLFKSAHEDYVTVAGGDFNVGRLEEPVCTLESSLSGEISQTPTLTSSVNQAIDHSTQTDATTLIHEPSSEACNQVKHLQDQLAKMELALDSSTTSRDKYRESHRLLKELLSKELPVIKDVHCRSRELVENWLMETKNYVESSLSELKVREEERTRELRVRMSAVQWEREELETKRQMTREELKRQITSEFEGERRRFEELRTQLEHEKNSLLEDVERLQNDKEENDSQHKCETERLQELIQDYRSKYEAQQSTTQKLQGHKSLSEEGQQIRFNSIITKMKREKGQAVELAMEKVKEVELQVQQQRELTKLAIEEKETLAQLTEAEGATFLQREQELVASLSVTEAKLQEAEKTLRDNDQRFQQMLAEERAKAMLLLEVERQMWEAKEARQGNQTEAERGTDAIVEEEYVQRIQLLEKKNKALLERMSGQSEVDISSVEQTKQALQAKDVQINALQQQLVKSLQSTGGAAGTAAAGSQHEKITLKDFQSGNLILLVFDERYENYSVLSTAPTLHFLHPESLAALDIATSGPKRRAWILAQLTDKEYCQAKKAHNRFHVPIGTKFYRIQAKPYEK